MSSNDQFKPLSQIIGKNSNVTNLSSVISQTYREQISPCSTLTAASCSERLMGCYRKGDYENPEIFADALRTLLGAYPESVVAKVTNPVTGIPGTVTFPPTIAEIRRACEAAMRPFRDEEARRQRDAERAKRLAAPPSQAPSTPEQRRAFVAKERAELAAKLAESAKAYQETPPAPLSGRSLEKHWPCPQPYQGTEAPYE